MIVHSTQTEGLLLKVSWDNIPSLKYNLSALSASGNTSVLHTEVRSSTLLGYTNLTAYRLQSMGAVGQPGI
jgi:hypothetical protein